MRITLRCTLGGERFTVLYRAGERRTITWSAQCPICGKETSAHPEDAS